MMSEKQYRVARKGIIDQIKLALRSYTASTLKRSTKLH